MRSRGLAFLIVAGLLGALYAVLSLQGGGGSRPNEPSRPATVSREGPAPSEPPAPEAPEAAAPGRERVADPAPVAAEKSPVASQARLHGRVLAADGTPVRGAKVRLREGDSPFPFVVGRGRPGRGPIQVEMPEGASTVTDAEGKFQFAGVAEARTLSAAVEADGFLPVTAPAFTVAKGERKDVGDIRLTREGIVSGTVTDPDGHPVAGARVSVEVDPTKMFRGGPLFFQEEKTDDQGRYRLAGLPEGKVRVLASADGWREGRSDEVEARPGATVERVDVRLLSGRAIAGRVFARDGKPVAGAQVFAMPEDGSGPARRSFSIWRRDGVRTDEAGRYEVSGLAEGTYRVEAEAEGFARGTLPAVNVGSASADLTLDPLSRLSGRVVDGSTGKPVASFAAKAVRESFPGARFLSDTEDASGKPDGSFEIAGLEPGTYKVEVRADGFAPATAGPFAVAPGAPSDAGSIAVFAGSVLRVKVVEAGDRSPIVGAEVSVSPLEKDAPLALGMRRIEHSIRIAGGGAILGGGGESDSRKTGADGIAEVPGLAEGAYVVRAKAKDHATASKEIFVVAATPTEIEAVLAKGGTVKGAVTRANGDPFPGARVFLASAVDAETEEEGTSDSEGNYRFEHVAAGEWRVGLSEDSPVRFGGGGVFIRSVRQAGAHVEEKGYPVTVAEGKEAVMDLREKESGAVTGRVTELGEPVAGVRVSLTLEGQPRLPFLSEHTAESGTDGRFRIDGVPAGRYTLTAQKTGAAVPAEEEVQVAGAEAVVDVELPRGVIEGRILDAESGRGLAGVEVRLEREGARDSGRPRPMAISVAFAATNTGGSGGRTTVRMGDGGESTKTDSEGKYRLEGIPPGTYTLSAALENYADGRREGILMSRDAKVPGIDLPLSQGGGIGGTVVDALGSPVAFALVEVVPKQGETKRSVAGPDGAYVVSGLAAGVYDVSARIPGPPGPNERRATHPGVRVEAGRKASIDLRLPN